MDKESDRKRKIEREGERETERPRNFYEIDRYIDIYMYIQIDRYTGSSKIRGSKQRERERRKNWREVIYMSNQVKFVGVLRGREKNGGGVMYNVGSSKIRGSTQRERERERKKNWGEVIYMSNQVKFVGVLRRREKNGVG